MNKQQTAYIDGKVFVARGNNVVEVSTTRRSSSAATAYVRVR